MLYFPISFPLATAQAINVRACLCLKTFPKTLTRNHTVYEQLNHVYILSRSLPLVFAQCKSYEVTVGMIFAFNNGTLARFTMYLRFETNLHIPAIKLVDHHKVNYHTAFNRNCQKTHRVY